MAVPLKYSGTDDDVRPGDRIEYTSRFLRRRRLGTVVWIPAKTALELDAERKQPDDWLIRMDDGTFTGWMYHPEELQPPARLRLVCRDATFDAVSNEELERRDDEISSQTGVLEQAFGCAFVILMALATVVLIASFF